MYMFLSNGQFLGYGHPQVPSCLDKRGFTVNAFSSKWLLISVTWSCVSSGGAPTLANTSMFTMWKICTHMECEIGRWEWGIYGKVSCCFFCSKKCWSSGEYLFQSLHDFELPTCGLLQRGRDHSPLKACFRAQLLDSFYSAINIQWGTCKVCLVGGR